MYNNIPVGYIALFVVIFVFIIFMILGDYVKVVLEGENEYAYLADEYNKYDDDSENSNSESEHSEYCDDTKHMSKKLADRMKYYEKTSRHISCIKPYTPYIIRLDGRAFSKYTKKIKSYAMDKYKLLYSPEFKKAMLLTANDLLHEFRPATAYTHSDEISLIFDSQKKLANNEYNEHIFGGRIDKILSLTASFASVCFDKHINQLFKQTKTEYTDEKKYIYDNLLNTSTCIKTPTFDSRILVFFEDKKYEIVNHMIWRSKIDCERNFIALYCEKYIGKKNMTNMKKNQRIDKLKTMGIDLTGNSDYPVDFALKHGVFMKLSNDDNPFKTYFYVFKNFQYSDNMLNFLTYKFGKEQEQFDNLLVYDGKNYDKLFQ